MIHNESVKTFNDIVHHLELEVLQLEGVRSNEQSYVAKSSSHKLLTLIVTKNSLRRIRHLMIFQRKGTLGQVRNLSKLKRIRSSWNATIMATRVTFLVSAMSQSGLSPHRPYC